MIKYIKSKYDNTKEIKDVSNVRQSNLEHSIHSSEVSKGSLHKMVSLGGVQS